MAPRVSFLCPQEKGEPGSGGRGPGPHGRHSRPCGSDRTALPERTAQKWNKA